MKNMTSGEFFRSKRQKRGLTQEFVAGELGYKSKQIVSNWERGVCMPPLASLAQLVRLLDLDKKEVSKVFQKDFQKLLDQHLSRKI